jgi:putative acetyltransferase
LLRELIARSFVDASHSDGSEPDIVDELRGSGALAISLVAGLEGQLVGHVAVSAVTIVDDTRGWYGAGPISVEPRLQRSGVGSRLMTAAIEQLRAPRASGCVVLEDPAYYQRFGFSQEYGLTYPGPPAEYFRALALSSFSPRGRVKYRSGSTEMPNL